jgi:hypothetical protein
MEDSIPLLSILHAPRVLPYVSQHQQNTVPRPCSNNDTAIA